MFINCVTSKRSSHLLSRSVPCPAALEDLRMSLLDTQEAAEATAPHLPSTRGTRHVPPTLRIRDWCWHTFHLHANGHPQFQVYYLCCECESCTRIFFFFFLVAWLRVRLRQVSFYKYWHESLRLLSIFLWKPQYGNVLSSPFTHLFWLLAPGSSYCSNQCSLVQWHFSPFSWQTWYVSSLEVLMRVSCTVFHIHQKKKKRMAYICRCYFLWFFFC